MNTIQGGPIVSILPKNKAEWLNLRAQDVTSTESAALFGCSPYMTEFELWHRKKSAEVVGLEPNERTKWGTRLQAAIANGIAHDQAWAIRPMEEYVRLEKERMGASFDFRILDGRSEIDTHTDGLLEVKNVDALAYRDGWIDSGDTVEAPPHIEIQVQHQLAVSGLSYAYIGALVGGNKVILLLRPRDEKIITAIRSKVAKFWASVEANAPPAPNFEKDAGFIASLYGYAEPGKVRDMSGSEEVALLAQEYSALGRAAKMAKDGQDAIKAQLLIAIGDAEKITGSGFSISAGMVGPAHVEYDREPYRDFRIFFKKSNKPESNKPEPKEAA